MGAYYTYLISSLPMLNFPGKLPFGLEDFFAKCKGLIPEGEVSILQKACGQEPYSLDISNQVLKKWAAFEVFLRNELVRVRARRKKADPVNFLRLPEQPESHISHIAMAAYRNPSIIEAEKTLDLERWNFLESLAFGHYFDFDFLLVYALKLKILERWDKLQKADKEKLFNQTAGF